MEAWMRVGLNYMRALRHPCLVSDLQTRDVYPHGPAPAILSQPTLPRLWPFGRGSRRDPQPEGAPLSLQALRPYLLRDPGYCPLPSTQAEVAGTYGGDVGCLRVFGEIQRRRLR